MTEVVWVSIRNIQIDVDVNVKQVLYFRGRFLTQLSSLRKHGEDLSYGEHIHDQRFGKGI